MWPNKKRERHQGRDPTMQIPQQHCRAGPSRGQAHHAPGTRLQAFRLCADHSGWRRHDPQRADARRRERSVPSSTILPTSGVTPTGSLTRVETVPPTLTRAPLNATEPKSAWDTGDVGARRRRSNRAHRVARLSRLPEHDPRDVIADIPQLRLGGNCVGQATQSASNDRQTDLILQQRQRVVGA